jgi:hypothetical protein
MIVNQLVNKLVLGLMLICLPVAVRSAPTSVSMPSTGFLHVRYTIKLTSPVLPKSLIEAAVRDIKKKGTLTKHDIDEIDYLRLREVNHSREDSGEYWSNGGNSFCWRMGGTSIMSDGTVLRLVHINRPGSIDPNIRNTGGNIDIQPAGAPGSGVWLDQIPLLGFLQPLKQQYLPGDDRKVAELPEGIVQNYKVPHPYHDGEFLECEQQYDRLGRLTTLKSGDDIYQYHDFLRLPNGVSVPKTVIWTRMTTQTIGDKAYPIVLNLITLRAESVDVKPVPSSAFTAGGLLKNTAVVDARYKTDQYPTGIHYLFDGNGSVDDASLRFAKKQSLPGAASRKGSVTTLVVDAFGLILLLYLLVKIKGLLRTDTAKESE